MQSEIAGRRAALAKALGEGTLAATGLSAASASGLAAAVKAALKPGDTLRVANDTNPGQPLGDLLEEVRAGGNQVALRSVQGPINRLRAVKSASEMALIRK